MKEKLPYGCFLAVLSFLLLPAGALPATLYSPSAGLGMGQHRSDSGTLYFPSPDGVLYVKKGATGSGSAWNDAMGEFADALLAAQVLNGQAAGSVIEIWVAGGTYLPKYRPDTFEAVANDRDRTFRMVPGVKVYGGFSGAETLLSERDFSNTDNETILSGDFNLNDIPGNIFSNNNVSENAHHVVVYCAPSSDPITAGSVLDGFTITGGNADTATFLDLEGISIERQSGGGMVLYNASPFLANLIFRLNAAWNFGGGADANLGAAPRLLNCAFRQNWSTMGGGLSCRNTTTALPVRMDRVVFSCNKANIGGGIYNAPGNGAFLSNSLFAGNTGDYLGGAVANDQTGLMYLTNVSISGNAAAQGGGGIISLGVVYLRNSIVYNNMGNVASLSNGSITASYSIIGGGYPGENNLDVDPLFVNAPSNIGDPFLGGDYSLLPGSPAINAGNNAYFAPDQEPDLTGMTVDLAGNARIVQLTVDLGAFETPCATAIPTVGPQAFCTGATVADLEATGDDVKWYATADAETPLAGTELLTSGTYFVTQTILTCESEKAPVAVTVNETEPPTGASLQEIEVESGQVATFADLDVAGTNVLWYFSEEEALEGGNPAPIDTELVNGATYYAMRIENGCPSAILPVTVNIVLDIPSMEKNRIRCYPNPVYDRLKIAADTTIEEIRVYSLPGQLLIHDRPGTRNPQLSLEGLQEGCYLLVLSSGDVTRQLKIIKKSHP